MVISFLSFNSYAQQNESIDSVDIQSFNLYNTVQWTALVTYGKSKIKAGIDFPLLRMRIGYASFILGNYSQSLKQYKKVYDSDKLNETALYYVYLNNVYLNNTAEANYYITKMSKAARENLGLKKFRVAAVETEYSYKNTSSNYRKDAQYFRLGFSTQLSHRFNLQQSYAMYNQLILEPDIQFRFRYNNIGIQQKEYYGNLNYSLTGKISLFGGYHYLKTPFNPVIYDNNVGLVGLNYTAPYFQIKAMTSFATISNKSYSQYDVALSYYPKGNTDFYSISKLAYNTSTIFTQVAGFKAAKHIWLEGNITLGKYDNLIDKDGLYIYNDIDSKQFKVGASIYALLTKRVLLSINYCYEQKQRYKTTTNFNQQSTTGGLQWKF